MRLTRGRFTYASRARLGITCAGAMCASVVLPGCGGGNAATAAGSRQGKVVSRQSRGTTQAGLTSQEVAFVIRGGLPPRQSLAIFRAGERIAGLCMTARGFRFIIERHPVSDPLVPTTFRPNPGGAPSEVALLKYRETHGFVAAQANLSRTLSATDAYLNSLPAAARVRWLRAWGSPTGCSGYAARVLFGSTRRQQADTAAINTAYNYIIGFVQASPDVRASTRRWSICLAKASGRTWTSEPAVIAATLSTRKHNAGSASSAEIAIAVADTHCAYSTGQASTYARAVRDGAHEVPRGLAQSVSKAYRNYLDALVRST